ncbi:unnamed protein product [Cuscuta campestris]|uniref:TCP domain-containing protein n=1 Tax=Cuscuta campestris TaxID=132261 RepID=A0A484LP11_9ASTE|nr:unnamed protein product [Cuscuta campestris]
MRLSLHVARRFFDLQDMLGFDKASKTIEWLLSKSECAIRELITSPSSCSEEGNNNKSEATEGKNVFFGKNEPMERTKEKAMVYEHCSNPTMISPFEEKEEEGDYNMIITNNGNFMGFLGNWEMAPF